MMKPISYISASKGKLELHSGSTRDPYRAVMRSNDVKQLARFIKQRGFADTLMASSSINFADEYGFATRGGAQNLFDDACKEAFPS